MNGKFYSKPAWVMLTAILCFIIAVSLALFITTNLSLFFLKFPSSLMHRVTRWEVVSDYRRLLTYLQLPWMRKLVFKYVPITNSAILHFNDVRHLLLINELILVLVGALLIELFKNQKQLLQLLKLKKLLWLGMLAVISIIWLPLVNFNNCFIQVHYYLFSNKDWIFNPVNNPIILAMPTSFFITLFILLLLVTGLFLFMVVTYINYKLGLFKFRTNKANKCRN